MRTPNALGDRSTVEVGIFVAQNECSRSKILWIVWRAVPQIWKREQAGNIGIVNQIVIALPIESVRIETRSLARFEPVRFDDRIVGLIEQSAARRGLSHRRMTSGAGHDAQMMARICPAAMVFVPSQQGISHNPREHTEPADLVQGANVLLDVMRKLADEAL